VGSVSERRVGRSLPVKGALATALAVQLLAGCGGPRGLYWPVIPPDLPPPRVADAPADGTRVDLVRTQWLLVRLPADPSSGYKWSCELGGDRVLYPSGETPRFEPAAAAGGSGTGTTIFTFRADGTGTTSTRCLYRRVGEPAAAPAKVVAFDVVAR
jgi:predicted secreted protein